MKILTLIHKDIQLFTKSRSAVLLTFIVPMVIIVIFGAIFGGFGGKSSLSEMKILLVDEDRSDFSKSFHTLLDSLEELEVYTKYKVDSTYVNFDEETMDEWIKKGNYKLGLLLPSGFKKAFDAGDKIPLQIHYDPKFQIEFNIIQGILQRTIFQNFPNLMLNGVYKQADEYLGEQSGKAFQNDIDNVVSNYFSMQEAVPDSLVEEEEFSMFDNPLELEAVELLGEEKKNPMFAQYVAGMAVMFLLFSVTNAGASILDEKNNGTIKRLLIAPVNKSHIILAKMSYVSIIGFFQLIVLFLFGWVVFKLSIFQEIPGLLLMIISTAFAASSIGIFIASICRNQSQVSSLSTLLILGMSALGGSMVPYTIMPTFINKIGRFTVNYWAMKGFTDIFWRNLHVVDVLPSVFILLGITFVFSSLAIIIFNKKLVENL